MTLEKIKKYILNNKGIFHCFRYKGSRNQIEEFEGTINNLYPAIFTILTKDFRVRSFSYSDFLIGNIEIVDKNN